MPGLVLISENAFWGRHLWLAMEKDKQKVQNWIIEKRVSEWIIAKSSPTIWYIGLIDCMVGTNPTGSMLHLFLGLKSLVKVSRFHTDCSVFRLHYRVTVMVLLAFTFIVTSRQYVGAAIMCVHSEEIPKEVLNTYCWIHPTYTLSSAHWKRVGVDVPHPGVDKTRDEKDKKHVKYYQWVGFLLFLQVGKALTKGALFLSPTSFVSFILTYVYLKHFT